MLLLRKHLPKSSIPRKKSEESWQRRPTKQTADSKLMSKQSFRSTATEAALRILAKKANEAEGRFKADVKAIVQKYGNGGSLTNVDPKDYAALVTEVEGLTDA